MERERGELLCGIDVRPLSGVGCVVIIVHHQQAVVLLGKTPEVVGSREFVKYVFVQYFQRLQLLLLN